MSEPFTDIPILDIPDAQAIDANLGSPILNNPSQIAVGYDTQSFHVDKQGLYLGDNTFASAPFRANPAGQLYATGANIAGTLTATDGSIGGWTIGSAAIYKDGATDATSSGMASADYPFYAGKKYADRATAPFRVTPAGLVIASNITITGGSVAASTIDGTLNLGNLNVANRGWSQTCVFSVTDADTVAWTSGVFTSADGTTYNISAGNTGNMTAKTYIYLDTAVGGGTAYQTTTTASTAIGAGKVLVAIAQNGTNEATFLVLNGQGGINIDASSIVAGSITANELSASLLYAGAITIDTAGLIKSGQTAYDTGTGWWIGNAAGTPKLSIGVSTGNKLTFDGTDIVMTGLINGSNVNFGGTGADGALTISSETTTIDLGGAAAVTKNYTSISITGTGKLAFSNPNANGTLIILKSQGNVTITSSTVPAIDLRSIGAIGGSGGANNNGSGRGASGGSGNIGRGNSSKCAQGIRGTGGDSVAPVGTGGTAVSGGTPFITATIDGEVSVFSCGGGGGGGGGSGAGITGSGGAGGTGGGSLYIKCGGALNITSTINASGAAGSNGTNSGGGGGGGGGGSIAIVYRTLTANSATLTVDGGARGTGNAGGTNTYGGGGGSGAAGATADGSNGYNGSNSSGGDGGAGGAGIGFIVQNTSL
jgi:hypothetical protein